MSRKDKWSYAELRITHNQADYLSGYTGSWSEKISQNTEDSLSRRGMLKWGVVGGEHKVITSPKGLAALAQFHGGNLNAA